MTLRVRQADKCLVESLLGKAQQDYKAKIKKDVTLKVDGENFLPAETCGGIDLIAAKGRIKVSKISLVSTFRYFDIILVFIYAISCWPCML